MAIKVVMLNKMWKELHIWSLLRTLTIVFGNHAKYSSDGSVVVDWIGDVAQVADEKTYYSSCCINGSVYNVQDHAIFLCNKKPMPSKIQTMWEDNNTKLKWVLVKRCYFPGDLPEAVWHPCSCEGNEGYSKTRELGSDDMLDQLPDLQQLLYRPIGCRFFEMPWHKAMKALDIYKRVGQQIYMADQKKEKSTERERDRLKFSAILSLIMSDLGFSYSPSRG